MFGVTENTLWVESFRPDTMDGYIGNEHIIDKVKIFIKNGDVPHLLFFGPAGTGKTTTISTLVNSLWKAEKKAVLLAPTGRAAKVIAVYSKKPAFTIHKKIYFPTLNSHL